MHLLTNERFNVIINSRQREKGESIMNLVKDITYNNPCYTNGRTIRPKGLMLHSVGCPQPNPDVFRNTWNKSSCKVGVHYVGGRDKIIQCLPDTTRAWHCGGSGNNDLISYEMTEPATIRYTGGSSFVDNNPTESRAHVIDAYKTAVEFFASKCKEYGFDPMKDIISHCEGARKGIASHHGDPDHVFSHYGLTMDMFRRDVKNFMEGSSGGGGATNGNNNGGSGASNGELYRVRRSWSDTKSQLGAYRNLESAKALCDKNTGYHVYDSKGNEVYPAQHNTGTSGNVLYRVRRSWGDAKSQVGAYRNLESAKSICRQHDGYSVYDESGNAVYTNSTSSGGSASTAFVVQVKVSALNIRKSPNTSSSITGVIRDKGCYTIVETSGEWGKLKSGKGWIYLGSGYTKRV